MWGEEQCEVTVLYGECTNTVQKEYCNFPATHMKATPGMLTQQVPLSVCLKYSEAQTHGGTCQGYRDSK